MIRILLISGLLIALVFTASADRRRLMMASHTGGSSALGSISYSTNTFSATSSTIPFPSGIAAGGVLLLTVVADTDLNGTNTSVAMTLIASNTLGQAGLNMFARVTDGSESGSLTVSFGGTESGVAVLSFWPGVTTNLADGIQTSSSSPGAGVAMTSASHTPSVDNCYVVSGFYRDPTGVPSFTNVSPYIFLGDATRSANAAIGITYVLQTTATAQTQQLIASEGSSWGTFSLSLKP
jgi:hypothetical protein